MQRRKHVRAGFLACLAVCGSAVTARAQGIDTTGDEFLLAFLPNLAGGLPTLEVQLTSAVATSVTVEYPVLSPTFTTTVAVTPGSTTTVGVPVAASSGWVVDAVQNNAIRLSAAEPFSAEMVNRKGATSDGALGVPVDALGLEYVAADYDPPASNPGGQLTVLATVDGTTATITPSVDLQGPHPAGVPFDVLLDRGEAWFGMTVPGASVGLSGTRVSADQPVSVSNGDYCLNVPPTTSACDHIFEVAFSVQAWRTSYLAANLPQRPDGTVYRVLAAYDGTSVTLDGVPVTGSPIDAGEYLEVGPLAGDHVFDGSAPILVTQYVTGGGSPGAGGVGDPAMSNLIPTEQFRDDNRFSTFLGGFWSDPLVTRHFLIVYALDADTATITLNSVPIGTSSFASIPGTGYSVAKLAVPAGTYRTESANGHGVLVLGYFFGADSYFFPAGSALDVVTSTCSPDLLDGGPCCAPAQPQRPWPSNFSHDALGICWQGCDVEAASVCVADWSLVATNTAPCSIARMTLKLHDPAAAVTKWQGRFRVQYARTWREVDGSGTSIQVWRYLVNGNLKRTAAAGSAPCPVPPCAAAHGGLVKYTGYIDMARPCDPITGSGSSQFAWMLTHACDGIDHQSGFPRAGTFHPDRTYSFVGPALGFVPTPLLGVESGTTADNAARRVDVSGFTPVCEYEEPADLSLAAGVGSCFCDVTVLSPQFVVSDLTLAGSCGTTLFTPGGPYLPGFVSMSVGSWTDPSTYPGVEDVRWNVAGYDHDDCFGIVGQKVLFGVTTLGGHDAFTIPSIAGAPSEPLPLTFIDQASSQEGGSAQLNVPWKKSDLFLNLNLP